MEGKHSYTARMTTGLKIHVIMSNKQTIKGSTQHFVEIDDIKDDIVLLRDGSACLIIQTTAVNFGLLSETEQDATIFAYAALLNSLSFPIQIVIRSKKMDISSYLSSLEEKIQNQSSEPLRHQMELYKSFIEATIKDNNVLDKKFYIVIPFSKLELGIGGALPGARKGLPFNKSYIWEKAKNALYPKRDHIARQLARLSLKALVLTTPRLASLYYEIFNPDQEGFADISLGIREYLAPMVEPVRDMPLNTPSGKDTP